MVNKFIPPELVDIILEYIGFIKTRNGVFMKQIDLENQKFNLVKENLLNKSAIINIVKREKFIIDRKSKIGAYLRSIYHDKLLISLIYKTIHQLIPPYQNTYYYMRENF
jgi:hypothetical protein